MITSQASEGALAAARAPRRPAARTLRLRDGRTVRIRPIRPDDAEALRTFDAALGETSHRLRYLGWMPPLTAEQSLAMATVDFERRFSLVATEPGDGDAAVVVADCRLAAEPESERTAEIAIAVADDHQDAGLGRALIRQMLGIATHHDFDEVVARVRYDNDRMMHVLRDLGFRRTAWELGVATFTFRCFRARPA